MLMATSTMQYRLSPWEGWVREKQQLLLEWRTILVQPSSGKLFASQQVEEAPAAPESAKDCELAVAFAVSFQASLHFGVSPSNHHHFQNYLPL